MTKRQRQAKNAAEHRHMRDRLLRIYEAASEDVVEVGRLWYPGAENVIADLSREFSLGRPRVAAIVAVLSPRQRWRNNIEGARHVLEGEPWRAPGYDVNRDKAVALANAAPLEAIIGGEKVTSFWANLIGSRTAVTVDVWAQRAALGYYHRHQPKRGRYERLVAIYRASAEAAGETPREFQSIVWNAVRPAVEHKRDWESVYGTAS
jgi:hypothetical protein